MFGLFNKMRRSLAARREAAYARQIAELSSELHDLLERSKATTRQAEKVAAEAGELRRKVMTLLLSAA